MKPKEFYQIMERFVEEDKRWRALKVGDVIYEVNEFTDSELGVDPMQFFKMIINSIDVDERHIVASDSNPDIMVTRKIGEFWTQKEYDKMFNNPLIKN